MMKKFLYVFLLFIPLSAYSGTYRVNKTGLLLQTKHLKNGNIQFDIYNSRNSEKNSLVQGVAKLKSGDLEINTDEETGLGYAVDEYIHDKNQCFISIRLDVEKGKKGSLKTSCPKQNELRHLNLPILKIK